MSEYIYCTHWLELDIFGRVFEMWSKINGQLQKETGRKQFTLPVTPPRVSYVELQLNPEK